MASPYTWDTDPQFLQLMKDNTPLQRADTATLPKLYADWRRRTPAPLSPMANPAVARPAVPAQQPAAAAAPARPATPANAPKMVPAEQMSLGDQARQLRVISNGQVPVRRSPITNEASLEEKMADNKLGPHIGVDGLPAMWKVPQQTESDPRYARPENPFNPAQTGASITYTGADGTVKNWDFAQKKFFPAAAPAPATYSGGISTVSKPMGGSFGTAPRMAAPAPASAPSAPPAALTPSMQPAAVQGSTSLNSPVPSGDMDEYARRGISPRGAENRKALGNWWDNRVSQMQPTFNGPAGNTFAINAPSSGITPAPRPTTPMSSDGLNRAMLPQFNDAAPGIRPAPRADYPSPSFVPLSTDNSNRAMNQDVPVSPVTRMPGYSYDMRSGLPAPSWAKPAMARVNGGITPAPRPDMAQPYPGVDVPEDYRNRRY